MTSPRIEGLDLCFFSIWVALSGSMNITGSCLVLKLDNNLRSCCLCFFSKIEGAWCLARVSLIKMDVKVCDCQTRNIWHPWLSQRNLQEPPFRWELPEKMYTLPLPKTNSKRPWKMMLGRQAFRGKRPFYGGYLSFVELGFRFSREWMDLFFLSKTLSKLLHLELMWVIIVLFRYKPHGFRPFANPIFVKQTKTSKKNKFPENSPDLWYNSEMFPVFFGRFFLSRKRRRKKNFRRTKSQMTSSSLSTCALVRPAPFLWMMGTIGANF